MAMLRRERERERVWQKEDCDGAGAAMCEAARMRRRLNVWLLPSALLLLLPSAEGASVRELLLLLLLLLRVRDWCCCYFSFRVHSTMAPCSWRPRRAAQSQ